MFSPFDKKKKFSPEYQLQSNPPFRQKDTRNELQKL